MSSPRAEAIAAAYRERLHALRAEVARRLGIAYEAVTEDDIRATYAAFMPIAGRTITAGQARAHTLTRAYVRAVSRFDPLAVPSLAGTTMTGTMADGLAAIVPLILGAIGKGSDPSEALTAGGGYVDRLADGEITRVVDAEIDGQADNLRGWEGIVYGATDECTGNEGFHTFDEAVVRHPHCRCDRGVVAA